MSTNRYTLSIERPGGTSTLSHFETLAAVAQASGVTSATARRWIRDNDGYQPGNDLRKIRITTNKPKKQTAKKKTATAKPSSKESGNLEVCLLGWLLFVLAVLTHFIR